MDTNTLPIYGMKEELLLAVRKNQVTLVTGQTGCGKTTKLPQFLLDAGVGEEGIIACTEPKRIAAIAIASRIAEERWGEVGREVGYHIRFEQRTSSETKLKFVTPGVLLREALSDPDLSQYACVIVDEAHERNLFTDLLLGYLKQICARRPEFKVVVVSATLNCQEFMAYFPGSELVHIPARHYLVEIRYCPVGNERIIAKAVAIVQEIHQQYRAGASQGHVLVFMPGERQIRQMIESFGASGINDLFCIPLYGRLSSSEQRKVFMPSPGMKVIVATNVAESSLTIDGVGYVIDCGFAKDEGFDPQLGIGTLDLVRIAQSEAVQRAGRAGRTGKGTCFRLYSEEDFLSRSLHQLPEIARTDLSSLVLTMKSLGFGRDFEFVTKPSDELWGQAVKKLEWFGALDQKGEITSRGLSMARLPLEPRLAYFLLLSMHWQCVEEVLAIAAMLSVGRFFVHDPHEAEELQEAKDRFCESTSDFLTLLNIWNGYKNSGFSDGWCSENYLHPYWMRGVRTIHTQITSLLTRRGGSLSSHPNPAMLAQTIMLAFQDQTLVSENGRRFRGPDGFGKVKLARDSVLRHRQAKRVVCFSIERVMGRVLASCNHTVGEEQASPDDRADVPITHTELPVTTLPDTSQSDDLERFRELLESLSMIDRKVFDARYGLDVISVQTKSVGEVADEFGLGPTNVQRILDRSWSRLKGKGFDKDEAWLLAVLNLGSRG